MMKYFVKVVGLAAVLAIGATGVAYADGHLAKAVKARQAWMQILVFNLGNLGAMAKGDVAYDAAKATDFANNLVAATSMKNAAMWPAGSGNDKLGDKTRAKPEIWTSFPEVAKHLKNLSAASQELAKVAGNGVDDLKGGVGGVGKNCGACHKPFRAKKK